MLLLAIPQPEDARSLVIIAPLTSQIRGMRGEVDIGKPRWLPKYSAINVQGLASFDHNKLTRKLGTLPVEQYTEVKKTVRDILHL